MLYTVEIRFLCPDEEPAWNAWYDQQLGRMLQIPGLDTAQRFRRRGSASEYLAMYSIRQAAVLQGAAYRKFAGAGPRSPWRDYIRRRRNLYGGIRIAPAVANGEILLLGEEGTVMRLGARIPLRVLRAVALDKDPATRALAVVDREQTPGKAHADAGDLATYEPIGPQLTSLRREQIG